MVIDKVIQTLNSFLRKQKEKRLYAKPGVTIAQSATVMPTAVITCDASGLIKIDENSLVNDLCILSAYRGTIDIGNGVLIGPSTVMHTLNHVHERTDVPIWQQGVIGKSIFIEDDVWIGAHCTILAGVRIGAHSVIGAHSLVTKDIPPNSVAYGVPCKVKRTRSLQK